MVSLNRPGLADVFNVICDETDDRYRLILRHEMPGIGNDFEANGCAVAFQSLFDHPADGNGVERVQSPPDNEGWRAERLL